MLAQKIAVCPSDGPDQRPMWRQAGIGPLLHGRPQETARRGAETGRLKAICDLLPLASFSFQGAMAKRDQGLPALGPHSFPSVEFYGTHPSLHLPAPSRITLLRNPSSHGFERPELDGPAQAGGLAYIVSCGHP